MARSSQVLGALLLFIVGACSATPLKLGNDWDLVDGRFGELMEPPTVIELTYGALTWDRHPVSKADVLVYIQRIAHREPRPRVYLYFSRQDYAEAQLLATQIHDTGICGEGHCSFKVTGR